MDSKNTLTEQELKYFEYWIKHEERPVKIVLIVGWAAIILYVLLWLITVSYFDMPLPKITDYLEISIIYGFPIICGLIFTWGSKLFKKRAKSLYTSGYEVHRTKILNTEVYSLRNSKGISTKVYYYTCQGIHGQVVPVSKKLYNIAKRGDDVTVIRIKSRNIFLGITLNEAFEKKYLY